jgi:hypothetical protein
MFPPYQPHSSFGVWMEHHHLAVIIVIVAAIFGRALLNYSIHGEERRPLYAEDDPHAAKQFTLSIHWWWRPREPNRWIKYISNSLFVVGYGGFLTLVILSIASGETH